MRFPPTRLALFPLLIFPQLSHAAATLEAVEGLARNGAPQLALLQVERYQPGPGDLLQWVRWEGLRLALLNQLNRPAEALDRARELPPNLPPREASGIFLQAAKAAVQMKAGEEARRYAARGLWQAEGAGHGKELRRLVIASYLAERRPGEAYRAMLRFQQDFHPLSHEEKTNFAMGLVATGGTVEAAAWLPELDDADPLNLLMRLQAGLITPEAAIAESRAALSPPLPQPLPANVKGRVRAASPPKKGGTGVDRAGQPGYWAVIMHAAAMEGDSATRVEAQEALTNLPGVTPPFGTTAGELWQGYLDLAREEGNRAHLLLGDDASWLALAGSPDRVSPVAARALLAFLALNARETEIRAAAANQLADALSRHDLVGAATRLFGEGKLFPDVTGLAPEHRARLGEHAAQSGAFDLAAKYWRGLAAPLPGRQPEDWAIQRARVFVQAGAYPEAIAALKQAVVSGSPISQAFAPAVLPIIREIMDLSRPNPDLESLLQRLLEISEGAGRGDIVLALARTAEEQGRHADAAAYYLQLAALTEAGDPGSAQQARRLGARSLARAGLTGDARRQYRRLP
jgi:hypothetical protein